MLKMESTVLFEISTFIPKAEKSPTMELPELRQNPTQPTIDSK